MAYKHFSNTTSGWEISEDPVAPADKRWRATHEQFGVKYFANHDDILPFALENTRQLFNKLTGKRTSEKQPTLADLLIREWSKPKYRRYDTEGWVPRMVAQARKFVLDKSMSEFMADLAYSWLPDLPKSMSARQRVRAYSILNGYRMIARLPHPIMWIEYDMEARSTRILQHWLGKSGRNPLSKQSGWLLIQHPKIETSVMAITVDGNCVDDRGQIKNYPTCVSLAAAWSTTDELVPWRPYDMPSDSQGRDAELLAGIPGFLCPQCALAMAPWVTRKSDGAFLTQDRMLKELKENRGTLRHLWSLLAAINDIPVGRKPVKPTGGHMVGASYKRFSEHTVISLNLPKRTTPAVLAKRVLRNARRRAHMVRGHFRRHYLFPLNPLCEHQMEPLESTQMLECRYCQGRKIWITEHQAGDASLGFVLHDYNVTHEKTARR